VFEPTHGSAPKYAGQYKVNPIAMLLTAKADAGLAQGSGHGHAIGVSDRACHRRGKVRTTTWGGNASTLEVAKPSPITPVHKPEDHIFFFDTSQNPTLMLSTEKPARSRAETC